MKSFDRFIFAALVIASLATGAILAACGTSDAQTISGAVGTHNHSGNGQGGGTLALSGTLSSTKACAANYIRVLPNYCQRTNTPFGETGLNQNGCDALTKPSSDAKALQVHLHLNLRSANAVALRSENVFAYNTSSCNAADHTGVGFTFELLEQVATPATFLGSTSILVTIPITQTGNAWLKTSALFGFYDIRGYWD